MQQFDVLIVGGGMVGATLAVGLAQENFKVALFEKFAPNLAWEKDEPYQPRVSALTRASENILRNLGAWEGIENRRFNPFIAMRVWEDVAGAEIHLDANAIDEPNLGYIVENKVTQAALWERFDQAGVVTVLGAEIEALEFEKSQAVLTTDQGKFVAPLIVGADGAFSKTRSLAGIGLDQHDYGQCAVVGAVETQAENQDTCWQRYTENGPFAFLAMENNISSIAWYLPVEKMQWALNLSEEDYKEEIYKASAGRLGKIKKVWERAAFPLTRRHAQAYVKPNLALLGDAAHTIHPQAGQGVNLGFLDAATLVEVLVEARSKGEYIGDYAVLRRFERWRKGDNKLVQKSMEGFDWLFELDSAPKNFLRQKLVGLANVFSPVKNALIKQALNARPPLPKLAKPRSGQFLAGFRD